MNLVVKFQAILRLKRDIKHLYKTFLKHFMICLKNVLYYVPILDVMLSGCFKNYVLQCAYMSRYVNLEKVKASTFKILRNVVTNSLAKQFSFKGSGTNKRAFRSLKLYSVIEGAFVSKEEKFNLTLVESATSQWLINAAWRKQEDGSYYSQRSTSHKHRNSPFSSKSHTSQEESSVSSHCSSRSQRLKGNSKLSRRSPKKCHRSKEISRS